MRMFDPLTPNQNLGLAMVWFVLAAVFALVAHYTVAIGTQWNDVGIQAIGQLQYIAALLVFMVGVIRLMNFVRDE